MARFGYSASVSRVPANGARLNPLGSVGRALQSLHIANDLSGRNLGPGIIAAPGSNVTQKFGANGPYLSNAGGAVVQSTIPALTLPFVLVGAGFFSTAGGSWYIASVGGSGSYAYIALLSSAQVELGLRFNFGTARSLPLTFSTTLGPLFSCVAVVRSATDYTLCINGQKALGTLSPGTFAATLTNLSHPGTLLNGGLYFSGYGVGVDISDDAAQRASESFETLCAAVFQPKRRAFSASLAIPVLSAPSYTALTATTVKPRVTITF